MFKILVIKMSNNSLMWVFSGIIQMFCYIEDDMWGAIPGVGGTLIFLEIRKLGSFLGGFKILNFNIFGGFQKNKCFLGF